MRLYAVPLSYVSLTDINLATVIFPFRKVPYKQTGLQISVLFYYYKGDYKHNLKPLLRQN